jgi:hypothetical protein
VVAGIGPAAAIALPPPGEDPGGDPVERPTPTRPAPTPRQIESFSVSTDSVVATATLRYNGDPGAATVLWGDGTGTSLCPAGQEGPLHSGCMPTPFDSGSAAGTLVFKHRYTAPANGAPFTVVITGKLGAESQSIAIGVTPRYKVAVSDIEFSPLSHDCDTAAEEYTEWKVSREVYNDATTIVPRGMSRGGLEVRPPHQPQGGRRRLDSAPVRGVARQWLLGRAQGVRSPGPRALDNRNRPC